MFEITTRAIILDKNPERDHDAVLALYTEKLGKVTAHAKSLRKITAKLSAHTEPGMFSEVRLVGKNPFSSNAGLRLADSLSTDKIFFDYEFLNLVKELTLEFHKDSEIWNFLLLRRPDREEIFRLCGFGAGSKICNFCRNRASVFYNTDQTFLCLLCSTGFPVKTLLRI